MKYPNGEIVTTGYNNNMLPTDVSGTDNYVPSMTYDSAGRLLTRALGNGLTQTYNYYAWNQQGGRLHTLVTGSLQNITYQYDSVGNITQIANSIASETSVYDYDALDRLTSWQLNQDTPETYAYDDDTGNLIEKNDLAFDYPDASGSQATHPHAVTSAAINDVIVNTYGYDQNGNQTTREIGPDTFELTYDAENRLVEVKKNVTTIAEFTFDGDGARVMSVIDGETIRFVGGYYERKGSEITKYYMAGAARVAMRKYTIPQSMTVEYMLGDHLGSTSITTDSNGAMVSEMRYKPWGELRYTWTDAPANTSPAYELTRYQYTGQYSYDVEFGLKYYGARFYDSAVGRFVSADTVIPGGTQGYDRYAYSVNNPIRYSDPSGHWPCESFSSCVALGASVVQSTVEYISQNPINISKRLTMTLPVVIPSGFGLAPGIINHTIDLKVAIRATGRTVGDDVLGPVALAAGYLATVAPNQIENKNTGASWNDYAGDFLVDSFGFAYSEAAGDAAGLALIETGPGALVGNFAADIAAGQAYDAIMENGGRQTVINAIGMLPSVISYLLESDYDPLVDPVEESPSPEEQIITPSGTPSPY